MATLVSTAELPSATAATRSSARLRRWLGLASLSTLLAGGLHVAAAYQHVEHGELAVSFFLLAAAAQVGGGLVLGVHAVTGMRPGRWLVLAGLGATVGMIGLFIVAHGTDLLLDYVGQHPGAGEHTGTHTGPFAAGIATRNDTLAPVREAPGSLGMATVAAELVGVVGLTALLPRTWRGWALDGMLALCGIAWVLWFTGVLG
jgi:hypothetical protein